MPIYEYVCQTCAHRFEAKQSIKDAPLTDCPRCGKDVQKVISSPAIMFKGSGWYVTDYSDKLKPPSSGDGRDTTAPSPKESSGSPTPPAAPATSPSSTSAPQPSTQSAAPSSTGTTGSNSSPAKSST